MFRIITPNQFVTSAWKNGGGITHEVARDGGENWAWRLSIAEVDSDGPFSIFAGMSRILTVLDGAGIDLISDRETLQARVLVPVHFSGDTPIDCRRIAGAIRDFNVIFDPKRVQADVQVLRGPQSINAADLTAIFALDAGVLVGGNPLPMGAVALGAGAVTLGSALIFRLDLRI